MSIAVKRLSKRGSSKTVMKGSRLLKLHAITLTVLIVVTSVARGEVPILKNGKPNIPIVADVRGTTPAGAVVLQDAANWLADSLKDASGAIFDVANEPGDQPSLILARVDQWPDVARATGLT